MTPLDFFLLGLLAMAALVWFMARLVMKASGDVAAYRAGCRAAPSKRRNTMQRI